MSRNAVRERKKPARATKQRSRQDVVEETFLPATNDEAYRRPQIIHRLDPKTDNQAKAINYLDEGKRIVFLTGSAGSGKSMIAAWHAARRIKNKSLKKVYLVRPAVVVGKSVGMLPGDIREKLEPFFKQTLAHLKKFLGEGHMGFCERHEEIEMQPVEYLRGMSFENCIVICEECQNFTDEEMEMMLTRMGDNSQLIFTGDQKQHDLKGESGLEQIVKLLRKVRSDAPAYLDEEDLAHLRNDIGIVQFTPDDVVRGGLTKAWVKVFYHN